MQSILQKGRNGRNRQARPNGVVVLLHQLKRLAGAPPEHVGSHKGSVRDVSRDLVEVPVPGQPPTGPLCATPEPVTRPWGSFSVLDTGMRFKVKRIVVRPGAKLSLQKHYHRAEHWIVVSGTAKVTIGDRTVFVHENESVWIPKSTLHRIENPGKVQVQLIEVQSGEYLEEDDIVREEDDYGRT